MLRTGPPVSAHDKEKQKQKKRLSFKDPEIEGPKKAAGQSGGTRINPVAKNAVVKEPQRRKNETVADDFTLEDQALKIAYNVGQAFLLPEAEIPNKRTNFSHSQLNSNTNSHQETEHHPRDRLENQNSPSHLRSSPPKAFQETGRNQDYLDALSPQLLDCKMRCPTIETSGNVKPKNGVSSSSDPENFPTGAQHQIQLLRYQLEQQGQQTQTALHQVELLKGQLDAESTARYKAQTQNHQLMIQNKELLNHIERLFGQIEDLEKNVETLEQEKRPTKIPFLQEPQDQARWSGTYGGRRLSSDQLKDTPINANRTAIVTNRRGSLTTPTKPTNTPLSKVAPVQSRRGSLTSSLRPHSNIQSRSTDAVNRTPPDNPLRIGDVSPPVQKISNPFKSGWKEMQGTNDPKPRTNSLTGTKQKPVSKSLFGSSTLGSKRCSSSTSDLNKNDSNAYPSKSLMIDETSMSNSNVAVKEGSKLPQYQKYSSWQRSKTSISDSDRLSALGKDAFKSSRETSLLFNK